MGLTRAKLFDRMLLQKLLKELGIPGLLLLYSIWQQQEEGRRKLPYSELTSYSSTFT